MTFNKKFLQIFQSPWVIALIFLAIFFISTGYHYGWDDQHLEIPLLKHLIDQDLYAGDYYVESLAKNFPSYFYPILAKLITVSSIPTVYLVLFVLSRYFLFFWMYKLWLLISKDKFTAFMCVGSFLLISRVSEFTYRTFSHQEFTLAIIFAGIYFFFKERFVLSAIILGIAANLHALYSAFPMFFVGSYLLWQYKRHGLHTLIKSSVAFLICALPFIIWAFSHRLESIPVAQSGFPDWKSLYWIACPQNFFFPNISVAQLTDNIPIFLRYTQSYWLLIVLFIFNIGFNESFRANRKAIAFSVCAFALLIVCALFTYFYPTRFVLDLNLSRNAQYLSFLLVGFTTIKVVDLIKQEKIWIAAALVALFACLKFNDLVALSSLSAMIAFLIMNRTLKEKKSVGRMIVLALSLAVFLSALYYIGNHFIQTPYRFLVRLNVGIIFALLTLTAFAYRFTSKPHQKNQFKMILLLIPLAVFLWQYNYYRLYRERIEHDGSSVFWRLQSNWEDMQRFVQANTPKDAIIFVPHDMEMGGFRIQSERQIVCSYRDCGIIGFDYGAAVEWLKRLRDIEPYSYMIKAPIDEAIQKAIVKYKSDYIVFMRYAAPPTNTALLQKIYTNQDFVLFKIKN